MTNKKTASPKKTTAKKAPSKKSAAKKTSAAKKAPLSKTKKSPAKRKAKPKKTNKKNADRKWFLKPWFIKSALGLCGIFVLFLLYLDITVRQKFDGQRWQIPAQVYAKPLELYEGIPMGQDQLEWHLAALGYQKKSVANQPGSYALNQNRFQIFSRHFQFWDKKQAAVNFNLTITNNAVSQLNANNKQDVLLVRLDPLPMGQLFAGRQESRQLVTLSELPTSLIAGFVAVEDKGFFKHHGLSPTGIIRAAFTNIKQNRRAQGGSTLTQQLIKNMYLTNERSFIRKIKEALMALLLELHYDKQTILEAYLNEVYIAQNGEQAIHGVQMAARHFFSVDAAHLTLEQQAIIIGLVKGPSYYHPVRHPKRAQTRRTTVLDLMLEQGVISKPQYELANTSAMPSKVFKQRTFAPSFMDVLRTQLKTQYDARDLKAQGLRIFTTLDPWAQHLAQKSLADRAKAITEAKGFNSGFVQGAVVMTDTRTGDISAIVGGSQAINGGFNRAILAKRQIGSLMKPLVYLAAMNNGYHLASIIDDSAIEVLLDSNETWRPKNYDNQDHGAVMLVDALSNSYNQAAVRLSQDIGLDKTAKLLGQLGVDYTQTLHPSLALGAAEFSAIEIAQLYQTVAANGFYSPLNAILAVSSQQHEELNRRQLQAEQILNPQEVYLLQYALNKVMREGTGRYVYQKLDNDVMVAGKTGTTNDGRDSWFMGFTSDKLAVVWMGNDDNEPVYMTGSSGALRVWTDVMEKMSLSSEIFHAPEHIRYFWIDQATGYRTDPQCNGATVMPFSDNNWPQEIKSCQSKGKNKVKKWFSKWFSS